MLCNEGGNIILCENCPNAVHPQCIGLEKVPDDDWLCDTCLCENAKKRITRSSLRK